MKNFHRLASKAAGRLTDAAFRRRLGDMHRELISMAGGSFGAYLRVVGDLLRSISVDGMTQPDECLLLMRLASQVRDGAIVEIGSYRGRSTLALAMGSARGASVPVFAIEPHAEFTGVLGARFGPEDKAAFERNISRSGLSFLVHLVSESSQAAASRWNAPVGLLWIDADHRYHAVKKDFELWSPFLLANGRIAFDDSTRAGLGPHTLIREILAHEAYECLQIVGKVTVIGRRAARE